jgi:coproporphyrinogen III oxidase-like Fe-S oxidoreductase
VAPPRELELLDPPTQVQERIMLGLRLDETLPLEGLVQAIDSAALERLVAGGLVERVGGESPGDACGGLRLTRRGRFLGGGVTAELLV